MLKRVTRNSELVRERWGAPKRLSYGPNAIEALDLILTKAANAPINVTCMAGLDACGLAKNNAFHAEMSSMPAPISQCWTSITLSRPAVI